MVIKHVLSKTSPKTEHHTPTASSASLHDFLNYRRALQIHGLRLFDRETVIITSSNFHLSSLSLFPSLPYSSFRSALFISSAFGAPMGCYTHQAIPVFVGQALTILSLFQLLHFFVKRIGQPRVVSEILVRNKFLFYLRSFFRDIMQMNMEMARQSIGNLNNGEMAVRRSSCTTKLLG